MLKDNIKKIHKVTGNDGGFTLLEIIMAVSILTVGLLAVASMQISAMRNNSMAIDYTESTERVQDRVEKILNFNITNLVDANNDGLAGINAVGNNADGKDEITDPRYKVYWNVVEDWVGGAGGHQVIGVNTVRVIVNWTDKGIVRRYSFDLLRNRI